jgi:hypothetical protein
VEADGSTDRSLIFSPIDGMLGPEALCSAAAYAEPDDLRAPWVLQLTDSLARRVGGGAPAGLGLACRSGWGLRCVCAGSSGWLPVAGYFGYLAGSGLAGDLDPAGVAVTGDADPDERVEGLLVDAVVSVADDGAVDVA